jgi:DNA-directed RNA polymerase specialized sigma24 family protein
VLPDETLHRLIEKCWRESSPRFSSFVLPAQGFEEALLPLAERVERRTGKNLKEIVEKRMRFPDVYLSLACLSSDPGIAIAAKEEFTQLYYEPVAKRYVRSKWRSISFSEDRVQDLFLALLYEHYPWEKTGNIRAGSEKRPALLCEYRGEGPLAGWITLTLGNMIRDSLRTSPNEVSLDEERELDSDGSKAPRIEISVQTDTEHLIDSAPCVDMLRSGLAQTWKELKPREQLVLVLQTLHKVPPSVIARKIFRVHEGTITKYTTGALEKIRDGILAYAASIRKMGAEEVSDCLRFAREAFPEEDDLAAGIVAHGAGGGT